MCQLRLAFVNAVSLLGMTLILHCSTSTTSRTTGSVPDTSAVVIQFLEQRIETDPADLVALNRLSDAYLRQMRVSGDHSYISRARAAAVASLEAVPAEVNPGGLAALARAEAAGHRFVAARELALQWIELQPDKPEPYLLLHDSSFELGSYEEAEEALARAGSRKAEPAAFLTRVSRLAFIRGDVIGARKHLLLVVGDRNLEQGTAAWARWQLGELDLSQGKLEPAERHFRNALEIHSGSIHVRASLAKLLSARGDLDAAISLYEQVIKIDPVPMYAAALADLYEAAGRKPETEALLQKVETKAANPLDSELDNRQLALIWADHDRNVEEAYQRAAREYATRRDVYGSDVLAWTALKSGRFEEAHGAIERALRYGTPDARIYYHAGMIEKARGNGEEARRLLRRALEINRGFDFRQSSIARRALAEP